MKAIQSLKVLAVLLAAAASLFAAGCASIQAVRVGQKFTVTAVLDEPFKPSKPGETVTLTLTPGYLRAIQPESDHDDYIVDFKHITEAVIVPSSHILHEGDQQATFEVTINRKGNHQGALLIKSSDSTAPWDGIICLVFIDKNDKVVVENKGKRKLAIKQTVTTPIKMKWK